MKRWLHATTSVRGAPKKIDQLLMRDLESILGASERNEDGSSTIELTATVGTRQLYQQVNLLVGVAYRRMGSMRIPLRWAVVPPSLLYPDFEGYIEFDHLSAATGQLTLVGHYEPPLGPVGAAVDSIVLADVAAGTISSLAQRLAVGLERQLSIHPNDGTRQQPNQTDTVMRVRDIMSADPIVMHVDMPLSTAAGLLLHFGISGAPVVSDNGELVGVMSESDLLEKELGATPHRDQSDARRRHAALVVGQACTRPVITTHPNVSVQDAARRMLDQSVGRLVVVEDAQLRGIVTRHDVLRALNRTDLELDRIVDEVVTAALPDGCIRAEVDWGVAILRGDGATQDTLDRIVSQIRRIDGIVGVDSDRVRVASKSLLDRHSAATK